MKPNQEKSASRPDAKPAASATRKHSISEHGLRDQSPMSTTVVLLVALVVVIGASFYLLMNDPGQSALEAVSTPTAEETWPEDSQATGVSPTTTSPAATQSQSATQAGQKDAFGRSPGHPHYMHNHP